MSPYVDSAAWTTITCDMLVDSMRLGDKTGVKSIRRNVPVYTTEVASRKSRPTFSRKV